MDGAWKSNPKKVEFGDAFAIIIVELPYPPTSATFAPRFPRLSLSSITPLFNAGISFSLDLLHNYDD
jgi:hypothetical protein